MREKSRPFFNACAKPLAALHIPPLLVSLLAIPIALAFAFLVWQQRFLLAFPIGLLALSLDALDGAVARLSAKASPWGNYLEGVIDKVVDFTLIGSFAPLFPLPTAIALGASFLASFAKPRAALVIVTDNRDWPGLGERGDKLAVLLAGTLAAAFFPSLFGIPTMKAALCLLAAVALVGFFERLSYAKRLVKEAERNGTLLPYLRKNRGGRE